MLGPTTDITNQESRIKNQESRRPPEGQKGRRRKDRGEHKGHKGELGVGLRGTRRQGVGVWVGELWEQ